MLVNGKWAADWHPVQARDEKGGFVRQTSSFRNWVTRTAAPVRPARAASLPRSRGYYSIKALNSAGIVPVGPALPAPLAG